MRQNNIEKILEIFYEYPDKEFTVRELSKLTGIPRATAHRILFNLKKDELINEDNKANTNLFFKIKKTNYFIEKIIKSELIDELVEKLNPSCIILFGSIRKGDSVRESDVDIFIETTVKKHIELNKFEKKINHPIQLLIDSDINNLSKEMLNNIINGIKIFGSFRIK